MPEPPVSRPADERIGDFIDRTALQEFQQKSILYGGGAVLMAAAWLAFRDRIPVQLALPVIGAAGIEAVKNLRRWREWRQAHPGAERTHPDRVIEIQQETVRVMSDAVRSRAWLTRGLVACIAIPSVLEVFVGIDRAVLAASVEPAAIRGGDWWRLLTGTYLHGSLGHFSGNMGALLVYGSILESKTSRLRLPLVYLLSALGGSVASVLVPPDVPSIGASGGVVGIIGYLFLFSRRQAVQFPAAFRGATASVFAGLVTMGALGFWYIDNPGHAGGALTGLLLAGLIVDTARNYGDEVPLPLLDLLGWLAAAVLAAGSVVTSLAILGI